MCYDRCSDEELERFAKARHVESTPKRVRGPDGKFIQSSRVGKIEALEARDDEPEFHRFLDLPAELRGRIYDFYDAGFSKVLRLPTKPTLARTCRLLRQEYLPIFYSSHVFEINIVRYLRDMSKPQGFQEDSHSQLFLMHLSSEDAGHITKLTIVVKEALGFPRDTDNDEWTLCKCNIELHRNGSDYNMVVVGHRDPSTRYTRWQMAPNFKKQLRGVEREVRKTLDNVQISDGRKRFKLRDIHALRGAVQAGFE